MISGQLSQIVTALRSIKPDTPQFIGELFIFNLLYAIVSLIRCSIVLGSINGGTLQYRHFRYDYESGPFFSIKSYRTMIGSSPLLLARILTKGTQIRRGTPPGLSF